MHIMVSLPFEKLSIDELSATCSCNKFDILTSYILFLIPPGCQK